MSNFPDFSAHGYQIIRELGRNREGGRITWLATDINRMFGVSPPLQQVADWCGFLNEDLQVVMTLSGRL